MTNETNVADSNRRNHDHGNVTEDIRPDLFNALSARDWIEAERLMDLKIGLKYRKVSFQSLVICYYLL